MTAILPRPLPKCSQGGAAVAGWVRVGTSISHRMQHGTPGLVLDHASVAAGGVLLAVAGVSVAEPPSLPLTRNTHHDRDCCSRRRGHGRPARQGREGSQPIAAALCANGPTEVAIAARPYPRCAYVPVSWPELTDAKKRYARPICDGRGYFRGAKAQIWTASAEEQLRSLPRTRPPAPPGWRWRSPPPRRWWRPPPPRRRRDEAWPDKDTWPYKTKTGSDKAEPWSNETGVEPRADETEPWSDEARVKTGADKTSIEATLKASTPEATTTPSGTLSHRGGCSEDNDQRGCD